MGKSGSEMVLMTCGYFRGTYTSDGCGQRGILKLLDHSGDKFAVEFRLDDLHFLHLNGEGVAIPCPRRLQHVVCQQLHAEKNGRWGTADVGAPARGVRGREAAFMVNGVLA